MFKGHILPPGTAKLQYDEFGGAGSITLPFAVCYSLKELLDFHSLADNMLAAKGVAEEQRGVAIMHGIHVNQSSTHARNKPTLMLVATQFKDNADPTAGKTDAINNPIIKAGWGLHIPVDIDDVVYDAGGLWP